MSAAKDVAAAVGKLITARSKGAPTRVPDVLPDQDDPVAVLVQSFLLWQSTTEKAAAAYEKIRKQYVDWNDLRVSMADEVVSVIGVRYPEAEDRCRRLRATLRHLYLNEHEMTFKSAEAAGKRSLRKYLEGLQGIVPYVVERTLLVAFGGHGLPVDETLRLRLVEAGIIDEDADDAAASALLLKHVKAADALAASLALQAWTDEVGPPKVTSKKTATKKTVSKKTTTKKAPLKKTTTKKAPSKKTPTKKTASKKTTTRKTPSKKTSTKKAGGR